MFQTADATTSASASLQHDAARAVGLAALTHLKEKGGGGKRKGGDPPPQEPLTSIFLQTAAARVQH